MNESAAAQAPAKEESLHEIAHKLDEVSEDRELPCHLHTKCHWCRGRGCGSCNNLGFKNPTRNFSAPKSIL